MYSYSAIILLSIISVSVSRNFISGYSLLLNFSHPLQLNYRNQPSRQVFTLKGYATQYCPWFIFFYLVINRPHKNIFDHWKRSAVKFARYAHVPQHGRCFLHQIQNNCYILQYFLINVCRGKVNIVQQRSITPDYFHSLSPLRIFFQCYLYFCCPKISLSVKPFQFCRAFLHNPFIAAVYLAAQHQPFCPSVPHHLPQLLYFLVWVCPQKDGKNRRKRNAFNLRSHVLQQIRLYMPVVRGVLC
ncbi:hypothetical protein [Clostridium phage Saumur]|nr:hypothetical protein [Clostridium phage Saumur]